MSYVIETHAPDVTWCQVADDEVQVYSPDGTWAMHWNAADEGWDVFQPNGTYVALWSDSSEALAFIVDPYAA